MKDEGSASGDHTTEYTYDYALRQTQLETPLGAQTDREYDALGRMTKETVDINATDRAETSYTYDDGGRLTAVTDANGKDTTWTFDNFGRELTMNILVDASTNPDTVSTTTKTYDSYGRLSTVTDPEGVVKTFNYDLAWRMYQLDINKASSGLGGPDRISYVFDDMDRVTSAETQENDGGTYFDLTTVTRTYDGYGQMDSETQHGGRTLDYAYDQGGAVKEITFPSGGPIVGVKYSMDDLGRVTGVDRKLSLDVEGISVSTWEATASFEYEGYREIERTQTKYDLERIQSWSSFRMPDALRYEEDSSNTLLTGYKNTWDKDGYIKVRERTHDHDGTYAWGEVYRYDEMGRITDAWTDVRNPSNFVTTNPTSSDEHDDRIQWNLGEVFERNSVVTTPKGGSGTTVDFDADENYKYTQIGSTAGNLTWDDNGQLTDWNTTDYSWTALGQMEQADVSGETARDYTYDAFGRRVSTKLGTADTQFLYHGWHMIGAFDADAPDWLWQEIPMNHGEGMLEHIALDTNDMDSDTNTTEFRQYAVHEDWQNTVWALSDTAGEIVEEYRQKNPFGSSESFDATGTSLGDFASDVHHHKRMHGGVVEEVSRLYDFRNRWYSAKAGAWLSRDPLGQVDSENLMQAMGGNPLLITDKMGLAGSKDFPCPDPKMFCPGSPDVDSIQDECDSLPPGSICEEACKAMEDAAGECGGQAEKLQECVDNGVASEWAGTHWTERHAAEVAAAIVTVVRWSPGRSRIRPSDVLRGGAKLACMAGIGENNMPSKPGNPFELGEEGTNYKSASRSLCSAALLAEDCLEGLVIPDSVIMVMNLVGEPYYGSGGIPYVGEE